jgi:tRNA A37 methylthiotransferase MiaB
MTRSSDYYSDYYSLINYIHSSTGPQAIRDEILNIMHRHHLPETKGNFIEEWHQVRRRRALLIRRKPGAHQV